MLHPMKGNIVGIGLKVLSLDLGHCSVINGIKVNDFTSKLFLVFMSVFGGVKPEQINGIL